VTRFGEVRHAVVDASAIVDFLLHRRDATVLAAALGRPDIDLHAPSLCDVEVAAAIRTALLLGRVGTLEEATAIAGDLVGLPIERYEHGPLLDRILELRDNFSAYDASYVALAEALGVSLLTADRRLAAATRAHTGVNVHLTSTGQKATESGRSMPKIVAMSETLT